jgi:hypothetical protein
MRIFSFLESVSSKAFSHHTRLQFLQTIQPRTELQLEYFMEPDTHPEDWCVTFPNMVLMDTFNRDAVAEVARADKITWKRFCRSDVAEIFMRYIDTVTFAAAWNTPARMHVVVKFIPNAPLRPSIVYNHFGKAYERLDLESIKLKVESVTRYWREEWKPNAMTFEVIHLMAADLGKMYKEMVW